MSGVIGISGGELARYAAFYDSLLHVVPPPQTALIQARGANIAENRNGIVERALRNGAGWIWFVDDDQVFHPQTLLNLLARDKDVVSGLYVAREAPFVPHRYLEADAHGGVRSKTLLPLESGLTRVDAVGAGCLLVKIEVFQALESPWWTLGQVDKVAWSDDLDFCRRVRAAGYDIWCDLDVPVGHQVTGTLWPSREADGTWQTVLMQGMQAVATWPAAASTLSAGVRGTVLV